MRAHAGAIDPGNAIFNGVIIDKIADVEIIGGVDDQIESIQQSVDGGRIHIFDNAFDMDKRIDCAQFFLSSHGFRQNGADIVFIPSVEDVYPDGFQTSVRVGTLSEPLEGASRPGHFEGVTTIVAILLSLAGADRAYFGQKDAQQLQIIRRMAADLGIATEIVACPIVREADGLALSSRNVRLTTEERAAATVLRRALLAARSAYEAGERDGVALRATMGGVLAAEPLAAPEYVSCSDPATLRELDRIDGPALLSMAVRFGSVRLIDNDPLP